MSRTLALSLTLNALILSLLLPWLAPSLTDPVTKPLVKFAIETIDKIGGERDQRRSGSKADSPIQALNESRDPSRKSSWWYLNWRVVRQYDEASRQSAFIEPNYQWVADFESDSSIARMSRSVGHLKIETINDDGTPVVGDCTGTLVSQEFILTAAHCFFVGQDPDFEKRAKVSRIFFYLGKGDPLHAAPEGMPVQLRVYPNPEELVCPNAAECKSGSSPIDPDFDFAVLRLMPSSSADGNNTVNFAISRGYGPARLGIVDVLPARQLALFHYPLGVGLAVTERFCLAASDAGRDPSAILFFHHCDSESGSSGGAVFSRDHEVVIGVHTSGERMIGRSEKAYFAKDNFGNLISAIARHSKIIGEKVPVEDHPLTAEQRHLVDRAFARTTESRNLAADSRTSLAVEVALDGLRRMTARYSRSRIADEALLLARSRSAQQNLARLLLRAPEISATALHARGLEAAALTVDGVAATSDTDGSTRLWSAETGDLVVRIGPMTTPATANAFSGNGNNLVVGYADGTARIWTRGPKGWQAVRQVSDAFQAHDKPLVSVTLNTDGTRLVTTGEDGRARMWDTVSRKLLWTKIASDKQIHSDGRYRNVRFKRARFSENGKQVALVREKFGGLICDSHAGTEIKDIEFGLYNYDSALLDIQFDNAAEYQLRIGDDRQDVSVVNAASPDSSSVTLSGGIGVFATAAALDRRQTLAGVGHADGTLRLYDIISGSQMFSERSHNNAISKVEFDTSSSRMISTSTDGTTRVWRVPRAVDREIRLRDLEKSFGRRASFDKNARRLALGSRTGRITVWDTQQGALLADIESGFSALTTNPEELPPILRVALSPDGTLVAAYSWESTARVWRVAAPHQMRKLEGHNASISSIAFSDDSSRILTSSADETVRIWSAATGQPIWQIADLRTRMLSAAENSSGTHLVTTSHDGAVKIWDTRTHRLISTFPFPPTTIAEAFFHPLGRRVAVVHRDGRVRVLDTSSKSTIMIVGEPSSSLANAAFSPDGSVLAVGSQGSGFMGAATVRIWDADAGDLLRSAEAGPEGAKALAFSKEGSSGEGSYLLAASGADPIVRSWRVPKFDNVDDAICRVSRWLQTAEVCRFYDIDCNKKKAATACSRASPP